jgi:hypothetical protein
MSRKKAIFFMLISFIIAIILLVITLVKDRKSLIGYGLMSLFIVSGLVFLAIYRINDSITKYRKIELENYIKNHSDLNVINYDINNSNAYIEMKHKDNIVYVSIFNKRAYIDIFDKEESKKLKYLEELEDESLKKEGFLNLMQNKKGITINVYKLSAEEIFFKIKQNL